MVLAESDILQYHRCQISFLSGALVAGRIQWHLKRTECRTARIRFLNGNFIDHFQRRFNNILIHIRKTQMTDERGHGAKRNKKHMQISFE